MYILSPDEQAHDKLLQRCDELNLTPIQQREISQLVKNLFRARTKRQVVQISESDRSSLLLCDDGSVWFSNSSPLKFHKVDLSELNNAKD